MDFSSLLCLSERFLRSSRFGETGEDLDCVDEWACLDRHDDFYGIEVDAAAEAPCQVGPGVRGGVEFATTRAEEAEVSVTLLGGEVGVHADEIVNRDVVSERSEKIARESFAHGESPQSSMSSAESSRLRYCRNLRILSKDVPGSIVRLFARGCPWHVMGPASASASE